MIKQRDIFVKPNPLVGFTRILPFISLIRESHPQKTLCLCINVNKLLEMKHGNNIVSYICKQIITVNNQSTFSKQFIQNYGS